MIFFDVSLNIVYFIRQYDDTILANLYTDNGRWFARVYSVTLAFQTLTLGKVREYYRAGSYIIFSRIGDFSTTLILVAIENILFLKF